MALRPDREYNEVTDISYFWSNEAAQATQEKGGIACLEGTGGSGVSLDDASNLAQYATVGSGSIPLGVLLQDVNPPLSATRDFKNFYNMEVRPGEKVTLVRKGWVVTDMVSGTPGVGGIAYVGPSGLIATTSLNSAPAVGRFESLVDADGFCKIYIDL
jgi:hypothetical protein